MSGMDRCIVNQLKEIEDYWKFSISIAYQKILIEIIQLHAIYEVEYLCQDHELYISFYNCFDLIERNQTYQIQLDEPDFLMIGQEGDIGYFISNIENDLTLYSLDLGALGSLPMQIFITDLRRLFLV